VAAVPASATVAGGSNVSAPFTISTTAVTTATHVTIKASDGTNTKAETLTVKPASLILVKLSPPSVVGGKSTTNNTVVLNGPAPAGGAVVDLSSSDPTVASVPASVTVEAGATTSPAFTIATTAVATQTSATNSASYNGVTKTANLTVNSPAIASLRLSPSSVVCGHSTTHNTVTLNGPAPTGGAVVTLTSGRFYRG
jgi:trimeric autotransporter adhesin